MALGMNRGHRELKSFSPKGRRIRKRGRNKVARMIARATSHELQYEMTAIAEARRAGGPTARPAQPLQAMQRPTRTLADYMRTRRQQTA